jgi:hypothetical protein
MDVAAASAISQADTRSGISIAVAKKALDVQRSEGAAAIALLQSAAQGSTSQSRELGRIDVLA